jgi:hypothetical protein
VRWLWNGAKIVWSGEWEFYYIAHINGTLTHMEGIEHVPFGRPVTVAVEANVSASQLGTRYIPSLDKILSLRPFSEQLLQGFDYEVYGYAYIGSDRIIDPGMVRVVRGYFVKVGGTGGSELDSLDRSLLITELLLNRFYGYVLDLTNGLEHFHPYDSGIVYILPHGVATPYWKSLYGDRIYFYVHSNLTQYKEYILSDLDIIAKR